MLLLLSQVAANIHVLSADPGVFTLNGSTTGLALKRTLSAASGAFLLTGKAATLTVTRHNPIVLAGLLSDFPYITVLTSVSPILGTAEMSSYTPGQTVTLSATFLNTATGAPINPASVELRVLDPSMKETDTLTGSLTHPSTGVYSLNVVAYLIGTWFYRWASTTPYSAGEGSFQVAQTPFLVPP
jgi:hypothetical protein